jgi:hypothetical protein
MFQVSGPRAPCAIMQIHATRVGRGQARLSRQSADNLHQVVQRVAKLTPIHTATSPTEATYPLSNLTDLILGIPVRC